MADVEQLSIEELYDSYDPPKGSGNFFALKDGETARVRFQSDPYVYQDEFKQPDGNIKVSTRYAWLVWNHDEKKAQILKQSGAFYTSLAALVKNPDWGNPVEYDINISRVGTGTDTIYTVQGARKNIELDEEAKVAVAMLDVLTEAKEDVICTLREYLKLGRKFPQDFEADGSPKVKDL